ncbi:MAG: FKBP-type peptidyl-prolyl cis-trans isomerase [Phycisphaeraceae bacterium]|nr:FKBP-type peptidyl-prolyl cis-trans isomerase [Phycisphaeraceae bacterium]MCW5754959.1 FKBP-type peptidyl-prolyl cis-trans isomerase [Phycisphaeraceae bacterium]
MLSTRRRTRLAASVGVLAAVAALAAAMQPQTEPQRVRPENIPIQTEPADATRTVREYQWSTPLVGEVGKLLAGSWRSVEPIPDIDNRGSTRVVIHAAPVILRGIRDCLYVELSREDSPDRPYRQAIFQILEAGGKARIRTHEISVNQHSMHMFAGLWAAPEAFPRLQRSNLIASMDITLTKDGDTFKGSSGGRVPTTIGNAFEMATDVTLSPDRLIMLDRGYDAEGKLVWGSETTPVVFERFEHSIRVERRPSGTVIIEWERPEGHVVRPGDLIEWAYEAWVRDTQHFIGSSDTFQATGKWLHPGPGTIRGWRLGAVGATVGTNRTIIIEPNDGFPQGSPEMGIPRGGATLIYHIKCLTIIPQEELPADHGEETEPGAGMPQPQGQQGGNEGMNR